MSEKRRVAWTAVAASILGVSAIAMVLLDGDPLEAAVVALVAVSSAILSIRE